MTNVFIFLMILVAIFVLVLMIRVEIKFIFNYSEDNVKFDVRIYNFDLTKFIRKDKNKLDNNVSKNQTDKKRLDFQISLNLFLEILNKIKFLKHKPVFIVENFLEFGLDEANITAILYGYLTNFIYFILGIISTYVHLKETKITVIPRYNSNFLKFYFQGILRIRIAQIIYISFLFITLGRKLNGATSN